MIVFEGIDCCGKTTALNYVKDRLIELKKNVVVLDDWVCDPTLKQKLIDTNDKDKQVDIVLEARKATRRIIEETPKDTIILYDRYVISTIVYQVMSWTSIRGTQPVIDNNRLNKLRDILPYDLVYIYPTSGYDRKKFLSNRNSNNKNDKQDQFFNLKSFWWSTISQDEPFKYFNGNTQERIANDGTEKFFKHLDRYINKVVDLRGV